MKAFEALGCSLGSCRTPHYTFCYSNHETYGLGREIFKGPHGQCDRNCASMQSGGHCSDYHWNHANIDYVYGSAWRWQYSENGDPKLETGSRRWHHWHPLTPTRWRLPLTASETNHVKRAFWRFELFCAIHREHPTLSDTYTQNRMHICEQKRYLHACRLSRSNI